MPLLVGTFPVFRPFARRHAAVAAGIYLAVGFYLYKKGIAAKFEGIQRIGKQLFLRRHGILLPFALDPAFPGFLLIGIKAAGGGESQKQKAESQEVVKAKRRKATGALHVYKLRPLGLC